MGPARIAKCLRGAGRAVGLDTSEPMLREARRALIRRPEWCLAGGDAFALPFRDACFDAVLMFRFFRHFRRDMRMPLLAEVTCVLAPRGILTPEAFNSNMGESKKRFIGLHRPVRGPGVAMADLEAAHGRTGGEEATVPPEVDLEAARCNLCGADEGAELFRGRDHLHGLPGEFPMVRCQQCGLIYLNPRPTQATIGLYYPDTYYAHGDGAEAGDARPGRKAPVRRARDWFKRLALILHYGYEHLQPAGQRPLDHRPLRLLAKLATLPLKPRLSSLPRWHPSGKALDVGCGSGRFLDMLKAWGWDTYGVEISPTGAARARENGHSVFVGQVQEAPLPPRSFDYIRLNQVLEHLPDPLAALRRVRELMAPGGSLFAGVPNAASPWARVFGEHWAGWDVPRHLYAFTRDTLSRLLAEAGLEQAILRTHSMPDYLLLSCEWRFGLADRSLRRLNKCGLLFGLMKCIVRPMDRAGRGDLLGVWVSIAEDDGDVAPAWPMSQ